MYDRKSPDTHEQTVARKKDIKGDSSDVSDRNEEH